MIAKTCSWAAGLVVVLLALAVESVAADANQGDGVNSSSPAAQEDRESLRQLVSLYERAANEGKPEILQPYLDADFSGVMVTGDELSGAASLGEFWANMQKLLGAGARYQVKVEVADGTIVADELAVAHGTTNDKVTLSSGKEFQFTSRWTAVCRKAHGRWGLWRVHVSMNPISNPFVATALRASSVATGIAAGAVAGILGIALGWGVHRAWARRAATPR